MMVYENSHIYICNMLTNIAEHFGGVVGDGGGWVGDGGGWVGVCNVCCVL